MCGYHGGTPHFPRNQNRPTVLMSVADKNKFRKNFYVYAMNSENEAKIIVLCVMPKILDI